MYLLSKRIFFFLLSLEILLNKIGRDVISEIVLRISEVLFYSYNSCCSLCVVLRLMMMVIFGVWSEWDFLFRLLVFPFLCSSSLFYVYHCVKMWCMVELGNVILDTFALKFSFLFD